MIIADWLVAGAGVLALLYGVGTSRQLLAADAGTARMQEISAAVQVGARAYLNRQYTTIAIVGVIDRPHPALHARLAQRAWLFHRRLSLGRLPAISA